MDNKQQIREIDRYCRYLKVLTGKEINLEAAAKLWISKYAAIWRKEHPHQLAQCKAS
ncbi:MAG: hypothetical protein GY757_54110 [bacterium]|nr:hypothetical protein [bacterium]